jgi:hypothetical protein
VKHLITAAVLILACAHAGAAGRAVCRTPCGMTSTEGDCESLQRYETRALKALPFDGPRACKALKGWRIEIHKRDNVLDPVCGPDSWFLFINSAGQPFCAGGYTHADAKVIELGTSDWLESPLVHEIAHVADHDLTGKVGHCRWGDPRLVDAISDVMGEPERTRPESDCAPFDGGS